ncbi:dendritic cell-specific transmembrane protein-like [Megalops cyprinoides]|uniref:dendritic cell-specific transmembrane protein-like n=1 Tax=Megalops cyprinoides TaxID=118141 RepID=UPI001864AD3D|nr:dendritic cell-specific transmembrane protein-like [Megalops cyprinoides]
MPLKAGRFTQHLVQSWAVFVMLYTSGRRMGWRHHLLHFVACFTVSLAYSTLLFLCLRYSLRYDAVLSGAVAGACTIVVTAAQFFSKRVRCAGILFLIACGMQQGRNLLISAGTALVVFGNIRNAFNNLKGLAASMICNLEKNSISINRIALKKYLDLLHWVDKEISRVSDLGMVKFSPEFNVSHKIESAEAEEKLEQAKRSLNKTAEHMLAVMNTVSSVSEKVFPALGFLLLIVFTVLYLRSYYYNRKYENAFITSRFIQYDEKQKAEGKPYILPLTKKEAKRYITIPSPRLRIKEQQDQIVGIAIGDGVKKSNDFSFILTLFKEECLPEPHLLLSETLVLLSVILAILVVLGLLSPKLLQLKLLVSAQFYGDNEDERVEYLHAKILRKREKSKLGALKTELMSFGFMCSQCAISLLKY